MSGQGWEVYVWDGPKAPDGYGQLLAQVPGWTSLSISPLGSATGAGQVAIPLSSSIFHQKGYTTETTPVLQEETLWQVRQDGTTVFEFLAQQVDRTTVAQDETQTVTVSGPGTGQALNWAMAMPTGWTPTGHGAIKAGSIEDAFNIPNGSGGFEPDPVLWNLSTPGAVSIASVGTVTVSLSPGGAYLGGGPFDISNSSISAAVTAAALSSGNLDGSEATQLIVKPTGGHGHAMIALSAQQFYCEFQDNAGTVTRHVIAGGEQVNTGAVYGTGAYQYWRISVDLQRGGGKLYRFWTSGDGASWVMQWSVTLNQLGWNPASVNIYMGGIYDRGGSATAGFASVNGEVTASPANGPIYISTPIGAVLYSLIQAARGRGTIRFVTPTFGASTDSGGALWSDSWSVQVPVGTDLLTLVQGYAGALGGDWTMAPGYQLHLGRQGSLGQLLQDRIIFHEGEITQLGRTQTRDQIYNVVATADGAGVIYTQLSQASIAAWGQRESWVYAGTTVDPQSATNVAAAALQQFQTELDARIIQIPPNQPGKTVFKDFGLFDWIGIERDDFSATDANRVAGITVTVDSDGAETHELVLQTYRQVLAQYFAYLIQKFGGQAAAALGALPAGTGANGMPVSALMRATASPTQLGTTGASSGAIATSPSLLAIPEVAQGQTGIIPGAMLTAQSIPATALGFTLPGGAQVSFGPAPPANPNVNDLWYNTARDNQLNQWSGSAWTAYTFGVQAVGFSAAAIGGILVFVQATPPTGALNAGSLWYDTAHTYRLNVFQAGAWQPYQFGTGAIAAGSITAALIAANTITASQIAAGTITANQIAANTITAQQIAAGSITAQLIQAQAITAGLIAAGAIDGMTITGNVLNAAHIFGDYVVVSGANDGLFAYGQPGTTVRVFGTAGGFTWVAPGGVTSTTVYCMGGGGGGSNGGGGGSGVAAGGSGGGGGGSGVSNGYGVTPGVTYFGNVGSGGAGGTSTSSPQNGGGGTDSWFNSSNTESGATAIGGGGSGGQATSAAGGAGGGGSGSTANFGGNGGNNFPLGAGAGGGGGGAGGGGAGSNGADSSGSAGGRGGSGGAGAGNNTVGGQGGSGGNVHSGISVAGGSGGQPGGGGGGGGALGSAGGNGGTGKVILVYSAGSTTLASSVTGAAGADPVNGLAVPAGIYGPVLELAPQGSPPSPTFAGDGVVYASVNGTISARTAAGLAGTLDISQTDTSTLSNANGAGATQISRAWTIAAGDMKAGTVYVIEVPYFATMEGNTLELGLSVDGSTTFTVNDTISGTIVSAGIGIQGVVRVILQVISTGVSGSVNAFVAGTAGQASALTTFSTSGSLDGNPALNVTLDTTVQHNIRVNSLWGAGNASQTVSGYGSTFTRKGP